MKEQNTEYHAGAALVDEGIKFNTEPVFFGKPVTLSIRPLRPGTIIRISQRVALLDDIEEGSIPEYLKKGDNLKIIVDIIATAIVNKEFFKKWKYHWYRWLLLNRVKSVTHLYNYFLLVQKQMGPQFFFLIMGLTPAMNYLRKRDQAEANTGEAKPSGGQSDSFKKPSASPTGK